MQEIAGIFRMDACSQKGVPFSRPRARRRSREIMTTDAAATASGRKVFFLYPHSVLNEDLLIEILSHQYEIYGIRSHDAALKIAAAWPGSIFFLNIDAALKELQWEAWIRRLLADRSTSSTRLGILTYNPSQELAQKYLMDLMLPCGFIQLKLGVSEAKTIILKTLHANEARGRRGYVRAQCTERSKATFNVTVDGVMLTGSVLDISAAGMTFSFDTAFDLKPQAALRDVQLRMKGALCRLSGTFMGAVRGKAGSNLLMFHAPTNDITAKIHRFIFQTLQESMDDFVRSHADH
jgi:hypothetical protein